MSNSPLVSYTKISPNKTSPRNHVIDTITIHCYVGQVSVEGMGAWFVQPSTEASCNYGIGVDGRIALIVDEKDRSWCTSSSSNDNRAITIECACDKTHPYAVNREVYKSLIELLVDICRRNDIKELKWKADKSLIGQPDKQNMTVHRWFKNKACPGEYLYSRHSQIAAEVNARLNRTATVNSKLIYRVQVGAFSNKINADNMYNKTKTMGFTPCIVKVGNLYKVQIGAYERKENADSMVKRLKILGFTPIITTEAGAAIPAPASKSVDTLAREVIKGAWGYGLDRKKRLTEAGYDYDAVQKRVNEIL